MRTRIRTSSTTESDLMIKMLLPAMKGPCAA